MKRTIVFTLAIASLTSAAHAQQRSESDGVMAPINRLFEGMRSGDSAMVRSAFAANARLMRAGPNGLGETPIDRFVIAVGTPHDSTWSEPIWDTQIQIDGHLASVWTKYAFFLGARLNHCGIDAFQLYRTSEGWKIFQLTDTQHNEGCEMPPPDR